MTSKGSTPSKTSPQSPTDEPSRSPSRPGHRVTPPTRIHTTESSSEQKHITFSTGSNPRDWKPTNAGEQEAHDRVCEDDMAATMTASLQNALLLDEPRRKLKLEMDKATRQFHALEEINRCELKQSMDKFTRKFHALEGGAPEKKKETVGETSKTEEQAPGSKSGHFEPLYFSLRYPLKKELEAEPKDGYAGRGKRATEHGEVHDMVEKARANVKQVRSEFERALRKMRVAEIQLEQALEELE